MTISEKTIRDLIAKLDAIEAEQRGCEMRIQRIRLDLGRLLYGKPPR